MKFYVSSSWLNRENARALMRALEAQGHEVTHDWTQESESLLETEEGRITIVEAALKGILEADRLVLLHPGREGSHFEFGCFVVDKVARRKQVYIYMIGKPERETPFYELALRRFVDVEEFLAWVPPTVAA